VLSPLQIASIWLIGQFAADDPWRFPIVIIGLAIVVWMVAVNARVLKAALEWAMSACVALVILQTLAGQALLIYLFPGKGN
jgi:delta 1-pyrroline-5-carboxylate dehydrogenase